MFENEWGERKGSTEGDVGVIFLKTRDLQVR